MQGDSRSWQSSRGLTNVSQALAAFELCFGQSSDFLSSSISFCSIKTLEQGFFLWEQKICSLSTSPAAPTQTTLPSTPSGTAAGPQTAPPGSPLERGFRDLPLSGKDTKPSLVVLKAVLGFFREEPHGGWLHPSCC